MECLINSSIKKRVVSDKYIKSVVTITLENFLKYKNSGFSINLVGEKRMKNLNNLYRGKDSVTDVLAFALQDIKIPVDDLQDLGDIFICVPQIKRQAREFKVSIKEEFTRILVHGILHLLGFDHVKESGAKKMFSLQEKIVHKIV
ncbi:MAG: rRNA maturation RNase YbeY [Candidatus Magasanikbacteria bacterium]|nr:rRNA maturation RNase YbeY [Candidatus Magasanikbacteria bacterium]MBT4315262.1 rRNA maturation RNase YbeY [Candidatus Magasanikbacteria bacterium]MBT4546962.1 rRNA maturation RNase YbeY [Candidatus Magasanikbacteria bacterium]MBT6818895.1 rRNA maturation RNase YbeY [Candidatus Magasanikbacteria bacterium]